jgi:hypothetical protein
MRRGGLSLLLAAVAAIATGQAASTPEGKPSHPPHAIQDNSFLVEEAYNQEEGIVQHINLFQKNPRTGEWVAAFTQEYPFPGIRHQLSYTVPYQRIDAAAGTATGLGDLAINYRYQWIGNDEAAIAVAPRFTLFVPSGDERRGLGAGSTGVQIAVPASTVLSPDWIAHWNVGATVTPSARNERGQKANTFGYYFGGSLIWLGRSFDVLVETVWSSAESVAAPRRVERTTIFLVSPGIRWSYDYSSGLQIVPGIGVPIGLGSSRGQYSILLYLSFEHPFRRTTN